MLPVFDLLTPETLEEAFRMKSETGGKFLAGGTDLFVAMHSGKKRYPVLIDIKGIRELNYFETRGGLEFGALTTHRAVETNSLIRERYTALYEGCSRVGSVQIRARGTVGGNICNAVPSADSVGPLLVFDAVCSIAGQGTERRLPLCEFFTGPGKTVLGENELLKGISISEAVPSSGSAYIKFTRRNAMDLAMFGVSCCLVLDGNRVGKARIALTTAAPTPMRAVNAEEFLTGKELGEAVIRETAALAASEAKPRSSWRSSAEFRLALAKELTARALKLAADRAKGDSK